MRIALCGGTVIFWMNETLLSFACSPAPPFLAFLKFWQLLPELSVLPHSQTNHFLRQEFLFKQPLFCPLSKVCYHFPAHSQWSNLSFDALELTSSDAHLLHRTPCLYHPTPLDIPLLKPGPFNLKLLQSVPRLIWSGFLVLGNLSSKHSSPTLLSLWHTPGPTAETDTLPLIPLPVFIPTSFLETEVLLWTPGQQLTPC